MRKSRTGEESPGVPLWIVTFTDMTTNLLTFFVLLLSMGQIRDDSLFDEGQRISLLFLESVKAGFGIRSTANLQHEMVKYSVDKPEQPKGITKDAREEQTRRLFDTLRRSMQTMPAQVKGSRVEFSVANIRFAPGQAVLDDAGRQWLSRFCVNVRHNLDPATTLLYVVGVADNGNSETQSRMLAAHRSRAVAAFLRENLSPPGAGSSPGTAGSAPWRVLWWSAAPGASWAGQDAPDAGQSQILIAAMKTGG